MSDDRSTTTIRHHAYAAMIDAVECAVIDKGASKATRKAAFSAPTGTGRRGIDKGHVDEFASGGWERPRPGACQDGAASHG
jgi:hypothetical protein